MRERLLRVWNDFKRSTVPNEEMDLSLRFGDTFAFLVHTLLHTFCLWENLYCVQLLAYIVLIADTGRIVFSICICICVFVYVFLYLYVRICICMCVFVFVCVYLYL